MENETIFDIIGILIIIICWIFIYFDFTKTIMLSLLAVCFGIFIAGMIIKLRGKK